MNQERIGNIIKDIRIKNNLTQKDLADKLNVTYQAVSKWENGKNIPDIDILKKISLEFNIDISVLLDMEKIEKKSSKKYLVFIITLLVLCVSFLVLVFKDEGFSFNKLSTSCDSFNITGSIAYNKEKSSIYISNINYCGVPNKIMYERINCTLYEEHNGVKTKITECDLKENVTLDDYLKDVSIIVDNYSTSCNLYKENDIYIEINAFDEKDKITTYLIPLVLEDKC